MPDVINKYSKENNAERLARLKEIVLSLPDKPGSYQFYDRTGVIIYVGKAKNLKNRVSTYFHKEVDRYKTQVLVSKVWDISYTVVNSEEDALLLENALIKQYKPRYNVLLKDGKTYPSICITREQFPRVFKTRRINRSFGEYYGPYSHIGTMYALLELIHKMFLPRRCNTPLTEAGVAEKKYKACLEFHIKNCKAPCTGCQTREDYLQNIDCAREILKGNTRRLALELKEKMDTAAAKLQFEEAEEYKQKYQLLVSYVAKSEVVSRTISDIDVFSLTEDDTGINVFVNYMHVMEGMVNQSFTFEYKRKMDESREDLLLAAIPEIRERFHSAAREIVVPFAPDWKLLGDVSFVVPQKGDKRRLLELSELNGKQYLFDRLRRAEKLNPEQRQTRLMKELQQKLRLPHLPYHIECFDNSNISGSDPVASCVVFKGMKPSKKDYRRFNIRTVEGIDDYASMQEVVFRRYKRMTDEATSLPDLIITDGGAGHVNAVREVIEAQLGLAIPVAGLAKDSRHRTNELLFGDPLQTIALSASSDLFHVLTHMQDEVHRFAISFHRNKRSKHALQSELDAIPGVGKKTTDALLKAFKSVKRIKAAERDALISAVGRQKGTLVFDYFHPQEDSSD
ncbi:MAG: excinuclease ABC subunit UvrC [Prevotella sp.]|nr:excinuclease ABC subunit UvrC [Prevotella sp.]